MVDEGRPGVVDIARWAGRSQRLRQRRFTLLPLRGPGAVFTQPQGRAPSSTSTAPAELVELISSISEVGVLQPVLVEETPTGNGEAPRLRLVAGERRLRAVQWGATHLPQNPHFAALPAVVCPGPLTEEEVRVWQLVENLAREDLQPGELAAGLLFERCALLATRLSDAGVAPDDTIWALDDPVQRWTRLETHRARHAPQLGAPWPEVLARLGIQMRPETAKRLVRALRALPPELATDMDAHDVALATRLDYLRLLDRGRADAAAEIWAALKTSSRTQLLSAAVRAATDPELTPTDAVDHAQAVHDTANQARRDTQHHHHEDGGPGDDLDVDALLAAQRAVIAQLRAGRRPSRYDVGSLRLAAHQLLDLLDQPANTPAARAAGPQAETGPVPEAAA